ncbi:MAG TPA: hypothetical protein VGM39_25065 [Kofleriaceae bacterium]|jgi:hypothetical protein
MRVALCAFLLLLGCSGDDGGSGGDDSSRDPNYDCQPLCQNSSGGILGADTMIKVYGADEDEASDNCKSEAIARGGVCPVGESVARCSCESL